jgi:hypothetical protein
MATRMDTRCELKNFVYVKKVVQSSSWIMTGDILLVQVLPVAILFPKIQRPPHTHKSALLLVSQDRIPSPHSSISDAPVRCRTNGFNVLVQRALGGLERGSLPRSLAFGHFLVRHADNVHEALVCPCVDLDGVSVFDERNGAANLGLGGHVPDAEAVCATREASVGDEGHVIAEAGAHDCRSGREHLRHAGAALGALVPDDDDVTGLNLLALKRSHHELLAVVNLGGAGEGLALLARDLGHGPIRRDVAVQDLDVPRFLDGGLYGQDDALTVGEPGELLEVLGDGLARDRLLAVVHEALLDQVLHKGRGAADVLDVLHHVLARGLHVGKKRDLVAGFLEVVDGELDATRLGHRDDVQNRVGRATCRHHHHHGVLERLPGHDVLGLQVHLEQLHHCGASRVALGLLLLGVGGHGARVRKRHPQRLDGSGHRVGRVHAAAGSCARARLLHDDLALLLGHLAVGELAIRLEGRHNVELGTSDFRGRPGADGATVHHERGAVDARHGDDSARHVFVAPGQCDVAIIPLRAHHGLDRVGDEVARLQREGHSIGAHRNSVRDANGVEAVANHARVLYALLALCREVHEVHIARVALIPHRGDANLRLVQIRLLEARGVEHGL